MVSNWLDIQYTTATDAELDKLLAGEEAGVSSGFTHLIPQNLYPGTTGVIWVRQSHSSRPVRPLALVCREEDVQRLCGRYAQLRSELSPLSPWCHLLTPRLVNTLDSMLRQPDLGGAEAAWTGLVVAETQLLSGRGLSGIRIQSCLSTQTFAVGRARALWKEAALGSILARYDDANLLCRNNTYRQQRLRPAFAPIWECLVGLDDGPFAQQLYPVVFALKTLRDARRDGLGQEPSGLAMALSQVAPEAEQFYSLATQAPEMRLRLFDRLLEALDKSARDDRSPNNPRRNALGLMAGYLATVAAGGAPSISLVEAAAARFPELVGWAYVAGSIGEPVLWTSGFDGLGRLVARELMRPVRFDEAPACDFALDEAIALVDSKLSDPLIRLRVKQARTVTIALFPGVNLLVPIESATEVPKTEAQTSTAKQSAVPNSLERLLAAFGESLRPIIQREVREALNQERSGSEADRSDKRAKRRSASTPQLFPKK